MNGKAKFIDKQDIELQAQKMRFSAYPRRKTFECIEPEQVIYKNFDQSQLRFELGELPPGLLGKCSITEAGNGIIVINEQHYQSDDPATVDFSIGHELGHYLFHRKYLGQEIYKTVANGLPKFDDATSVQNYKTVEWQANFFAGALKLPIIDMQNFHMLAITKLPFFSRVAKDFPRKYVYVELGADTTKELIDECAAELNVSPVAFAVRLKYLGILDLDGHSFYERNKTTGQFDYGF